MHSLSDRNPCKQQAGSTVLRQCKKPMAVAVMTLGPLRVPENVESARQGKAQAQRFSLLTTSASKGTFSNFVASAWLRQLQLELKFV